MKGYFIADIYQKERPIKIIVFDTVDNNKKELLIE